MTRLETGESAGWPVSYDEIEPYTTAEKASAQGTARVRATPGSRADRSRIPIPRSRTRGSSSLLVERIEANERAWPQCHSSGPRLPQRAARGVLCATCDGYYCRLDAKMDAEIACIRPAIATGHVDLLTGAECLRVLVAPGSKRATGVRLRYQGAETSVQADCVAVCAGLMQTPLASAALADETLCPEGIGNDHGCLGATLCGHTVDDMVLIPCMGLKPLAAVHSKTFAINTFYGPTEEWPYPDGVIQIEGQLSTADQPAYVRALMSRSPVCLCMSEELSSRRRSA